MVPFHEQFILAPVRVSSTLVYECYERKEREREREREIIERVEEGRSSS